LVPPACRGNLKEGVAENAGVGGFARTKDKQPADNPALLRACKEFESLFVLQLWRAMQRTVPNQSKTLNYTEMFDMQFADYLSRQGRFGLAEQLYEQLSRHLPTTGGER
jgi:Rod binding domain-containing protein